MERELLVYEAELSSEQLLSLREHVTLGESALESEALNKEILDMVRFHHERHNGKGYPYGLSNVEILVFGRIAGVVDAFDAMTSHRPYAEVMSPSQAIRVLNENRDTAFQAAVVDEFIQAIGIYTAGTLVQLSSGEVAVVVAEGRIRRLGPTVMVLLDADKQPLSSPNTIDLSELRSDALGNPLDIVTSLEADAFGINISALTI